MATGCGGSLTRRRGARCLARGWGRGQWTTASKPSAGRDQDVARKVVREAVQRLDEAAWEAGDEADAGRVSEAAHSAAFARARAAAAVEWALDDDPLTAAVEAVYEAHAAGVPLDDVRADLDRH